jgi:uncharacterized protein with PQ loop repeat
MLLGLSLSLGSLIPLGFQGVSILRMRTVRGVSALMVIMLMAFNTLQFAMATAAEAPTLRLCVTMLPASKCLAASAAGWQFLLQCVGPICLLVLYMRIWERESQARVAAVSYFSSHISVMGSQQSRGLCDNTNEQQLVATCDGASTVSLSQPHLDVLSSSIKRQRCLAWGALFVALAVVCICAALPLWVGTCSIYIGEALVVLGTIASVMAAVTMMPQLLLLCRTWDGGALSTWMVLIQLVGNLLQIFNYLAEDSPVTVVIPLMVLSLADVVILIILAQIAWSKGRPLARVQPGIT